MDMKQIKLSCMYCQKEFTPEDILFYKEDSMGESDDLYKRFLSRYPAYPMTKAERKGFFFSIGDEGCIVQDYEAGGNIPLYLGIKKRAVEGEVDIWDDEEPETLTIRVCPKCHCTLPGRGLALYGQHRVIFLGDTLTGKTTYIAALVQQCQNQLNILTGVRCTVLDESKVYYEYILKLYEEGELEATKPERLFPIILLMEPSAESAENVSPCFIVLYDFGGEGMANDSYIANYPGIKRVDTAIVMVDANQYFNAEIDTALQINNIDADRAQYMSKRLDISLEKLISVSAKLKIRTVVGVLNKVDLLLLPGMKVIQQDMDISKGTLEAHSGGLDEAVAKRVSLQVNGLIQKRNEKDLVTSLREAFSHQEQQPDTFSALAVSSYTYSEAEGRFINDPRATGYKHRILEPLLFLMAIWNIIPTKRESSDEERSFMRFLKKGK